MPKYPDPGRVADEAKFLKEKYPKMGGAKKATPPKKSTTSKKSTKSACGTGSLSGSTYK